MSASDKIRGFGYWLEDLLDAFLDVWPTVAVVLAAIAWIGLWINLIFF